MTILIQKKKLTKNNFNFLLKLVSNKIVNEQHCDVTDNNQNSQTVRRSTENRKASDVFERLLH